LSLIYIWINSGYVNIVSKYAKCQVHWKFHSQVWPMSEIRKGYSQDGQK
jgi:hypothetical protein